MSHMHIYDKVCSDFPVVPQSRCAGPSEAGLQHSLLRAAKFRGTVISKTEPRVESKARREHDSRPS